MLLKPGLPISAGLRFRGQPNREGDIISWSFDGGQSLVSPTEDVDSGREPPFLWVVVHLAAHVGSGDWEDHLSANIIGAYNVYEAARLAGAKRVVFASNGATAMGIEGAAPYDAIVAGRWSHRLITDAFGQSSRIR